jgi:hypothetical protein
MAALQRVYAGPGDAIYVSVGECAGTSCVCARARRAVWRVCVRVSCVSCVEGRAPSLPLTRTVCGPSVRGCVLWTASRRSRRIDSTEIYYRRYREARYVRNPVRNAVHNPFPVRRARSRARRVAAQGRGVCFDLIYSYRFTVDVVRYLLR